MVSSPQSLSSEQSSEAGKVTDSEGPRPFIPAELTKTRLITEDPDEAKNLFLERGQYRIELTVPWESDKSLFLRDQFKAIEQDGEFKRIYIHKLSVVPTGERGANGEKLAKMTVVFRAVDNPIWVPAAIWGFNIIAGSVGAWFVVDKVEGFSETIAFLIRGIWN